MWIGSSSIQTGRTPVPVQPVRVFGSHCATRVLSPDEDDLKKLERILSYLLYTKSQGMVLRIGPEIQLKAYVDASFGTYEDMKSVNDWQCYSLRKERQAEDSYQVIYGGGAGWALGCPVPNPMDSGVSLQPRTSAWTSNCLPG